MNVIRHPHVDVQQTGRSTQGKHTAMIHEFWGSRVILVDMYYSMKDGTRAKEGQVPDFATMSFYSTRHSKKFGSGTPTYKSSLTMPFMPEGAERAKAEEVINRRFNSPIPFVRALRANL